MVNQRKMGSWRLCLFECVLEKPNKQWVHIISGGNQKVRKKKGTFQPNNSKYVQGRHVLITTFSTPIFLIAKKSFTNRHQFVLCTGQPGQYFIFVACYLYDDWAY